MGKPNKPNPGTIKGKGQERPVQETNRGKKRQESHIHKERMKELKNQRTETQIKESGKTQRTAVRSQAILAAVADGTKSARDIASKQIELQQLLSGNRFSNNDAANDERTSSGNTNGGGNSVTDNPAAGDATLKG